MDSKNRDHVNEVEGNNGEFVLFPKIEPSVPVTPPPSRLSRIRKLLPLRIIIPVVLFALTVLSTYYTVYWTYPDRIFYCASVMSVLIFHEMGHYLTALYYRVPTTLPFFIPMPLSPFGTMGAVIAMPPNAPNRRVLFDIGIAGPIAGLIPVVICCIYGLRNSTLIEVAAKNGPGSLGEPLIFKLLIRWILGELGEHQDVLLHPVAFAGWIGIFLTTLNLIPIGQLDGGHVLYGILRKRSHPIAQGLLLVGILTSVIMWYTQWWLILVLLTIMRPKHPPTSNDDVPLGRGRVILGVLMLCFVPFGLMPQIIYL